MQILVDTNLLLRALNPGEEHYGAANAALQRWTDHDDILVLVPQNIYEYWAVLTRPVSANGYNLSTATAVEEIARLKTIFRILPDTPAIFPEWERLVAAYGVSGKPSHDARFVAATIVHGVSHILTFNASDFARYTEVSTLDPLN